MKQWLYALIVAFVLSINGIAEPQTKSEFPKIDVQNTLMVEFRNCDDVIYSVTVNGVNKDIKYLVYEVGSTTFAIIEFDIGPKQDAVAMYILQPDKSVLKYLPKEFSKLAGPCQTIKTAKLSSDRNKF